MRRKLLLRDTADRFTPPKRPEDARLEERPLTYDEAVHSFKERTTTVEIKNLARGSRVYVKANDIQICNKLVPRGGSIVVEVPKKSNVLVRVRKEGLKEFDAYFHAVTPFKISAIQISDV